MSFFTLSRPHFEAAVTKHFLVEPADRNYLYCRFFRGMGDLNEHAWQGLQAVEKYLKAALVLNGVSVINYSHDLFALKNRFDEVFGDLTIKQLQKPDKLKDELWSNDPLNHILLKLHVTGKPDSRYGLVSATNFGEDLFIMDCLVYELRRRTVGLDWPVTEQWPNDERIAPFVGMTFRDVIANDTTYMFRPLPAFEKVDFSELGRNFEDVFYNWNLPFSRNLDDLKKPAPPKVAAPFGGFKSSMIHPMMTEAQKVEGSLVGETIDRLKWIITGFKLFKPDAKALSKIIAELSTRK